MARHNGTPNLLSGWHPELFYEKPCVVCQTIFKPKSGVHKFCSEKCKGKWQYITGSGSTENQYKYISGDWRRYFARLTNKSQRRENISIEDCLELLAKQDGLCALSGVELTCLLEKGKKFKTNASLDRIKAGLPYTKDNIQLVCAAVNCWRGDTELEEFIWFCNRIAEKHAR